MPDSATRVGPSTVVRVDEHRPRANEHVRRRPGVTRIASPVDSRHPTARPAASGARKRLHRRRTHRVRRRRLRPRPGRSSMLAARSAAGHQPARARHHARSPQVAAVLRPARRSRRGSPHHRGPRPTRRRVSPRRAQLAAEQHAAPPSPPGPASSRGRERYCRSSNTPQPASVSRVRGRGLVVVREGFCQSTLWAGGAASPPRSRGTGAGGRAAPIRSVRPARCARARSWRRTRPSGPIRARPRGGRTRPRSRDGCSPAPGRRARRRSTPRPSRCAGRGARHPGSARSRRRRRPPPRWRRTRTRHGPSRRGCRRSTGERPRPRRAGTPWHRGRCR